MSIPLGRWGGEEMCMVGETWVMFDVGEKEAVDQKSLFNQGLYARKVVQ